jgi:hypothetical protein
MSCEYCAELRLELEKMRAELTLSKAFHDLAVKERDYARIRFDRLKKDKEDTWDVCHDGSESACSKSHED